MKTHIKHKRNELIWALSAQDYTSAEVADIFNMSRQRAHVIISEKPQGWSSPWIKVK